MVLDGTCEGAQADFLQTSVPAPTPVAQGTSASPALLPKGGSRVLLPLQDGSQTMPRPLLLSRPRETFLPCKESALILAFLLPASLTPPCSWSSLCRVVRPSPISTAEQLQSEFPLCWNTDASSGDLPQVRSKTRSNTKMCSLLPSHLSFPRLSANDHRTALPWKAHADCSLHPLKEGETKGMWHYRGMEGVDRAAQKSQENFSSSCKKGHESRG